MTMKPCVSRALRDILAPLEDHPELVGQFIKVIDLCDPPEVKAAPKEESCEVIFDRAKQTLNDVRHLITEGAPPELYRALGTALDDIGRCASTPILRQAKAIFQDINQVTAVSYYKGEGQALNRRVTELSRLLEKECEAKICTIRAPREFSPSFLESLSG